MQKAPITPTAFVYSAVQTREKIKKNRTTAPDHKLAQPILLFLAAKLFIYTLLGALLGWLGSMLSLSPWTRGILQVLIGVFMLGNALRMLNVHPIFRYFSFEPPARITRFIRRRSKMQGTILTPIFLGILTVFIPCGITQSMMALAVSTGSALQGALILFAFTLGASPVFFVLTYLATRLGSLMEVHFTRVVAVVLLLLGILSLDTGLNLMGSPFSLSQSAQNLVQQIFPESQKLASGGQENNPFFLLQSGPQPQEQTPELAAASSEITILAKNNGYSPRQINAIAGTPIKLNLVTAQTESCSRAFVIPALNFSTVLPESGHQLVTIPAQEPGTQLQFTCSMGMYTGVIHFQ